MFSLYNVVPFPDERLQQYAEQKETLEEEVSGRWRQDNIETLNQYHSLGCLWYCFKIKIVLQDLWIPIIKIRNLMFIMEIATLVRLQHYIETAA